MEVRRHTIKPRRHAGRKLLFILLGLCLSAGLLCYFLLRPKTYEDLPRAEDATTTFANCEKTDIVSLSVSNPFSVPYTILYENNTYKMQDDESFSFSDTMLSDALSSAAVVITEETILDLSEQSTLTPADFGFTDNCIHVQAIYQDGTSLSFSIGNILPEETPTYYFMVDNDSHVYSISEDMYDVFSRSRMALHAVSNPALQGDLIDAIEFTGENPFRMEYTGGSWYLTSPYRYPLSSTAVDTLLDNLENLRFSQYVASAEGDLSPYGLASPRRTVTLDIAASVLTGYDENGNAIASQSIEPYQLTFVCGNDENDVIFYCQYRDDVLKASYFSAGILLETTSESLLLGAPINIPTNQLTRLEILKNGELTSYDLTLSERVLENNEFEKDEDGNILYDVNVAKNGQPVDSTSFLYAYGQMTQLSTLDTLKDGWQPTGAEALRVTLYTDNDTRVLSFIPLDALHWAVSVNGVALFYVENTWMDTISLP